MEGGTGAPRTFRVAELIGLSMDANKWEAIGWNECTHHRGGLYRLKTVRDQVTHGLCIG